MLRRKLLRDIKTNKAQFLSIFAMCFLGVFIYSGIYAEWNGVQKIANEFYNETNLADVWIQGDITKVDALDNIDGVTAWEERTLVLGEDKAIKNSVIQLYLTQEQAISKMKIVEGESYQEGKPGIYVDASYAKIHNLQVADHMDIEVLGNRIDVSILALVYHPEYVFALKDESAMMPNHEDFAFAFLSKEAYPQFATIPNNQIVIKVDEATMDVKAGIQRNITSGAYQILEREEHPSYATLQDEIAQHQAIGALFPVIFLLIAMLTTLNTMNKLISNQRIQIGTLKALGFTKRKLYMHYMGHVTLLCAFGGILGLLLGPLLIPPLLYFMQETIYTLPAWKGSLDVRVILICLIAILLCELASFMAIRKVLREQAASSMRPKPIHVKQKENRQNASLWHHVSFYTQWNLRDMVRSKTRSLMAIIGIMGCCALLLCSLGLMDSIYYMLDVQYDELHIYESKINVQADMSEQQFITLKEQVDGSGLMEGMAECIVMNQSETGTLYIQEDTKFLKLGNEQILPQEGIALSRKLATKFNLEIGDQLTWKETQKEIWHTSTISIIHITPLGQGITMSRSYYESLGESYQPTALLSMEKEVKKQAGIASIQYRENLRSTMNTMLEAMLVLVAVLILAAFVLGFVVLYNFTSLSFFERTREMATLKVLGFHDASIKRLTKSQNMQLCTIAICLALPLGYSMIAFMAQTLSKNMDMKVHIAITSYLIAILLTYIETYLISLWIARSSKDIDMVSSLKSME